MVLFDLSFLINNKSCYGTHVFYFLAGPVEKICSCFQYSLRWHVLHDLYQDHYFPHHLLDWTIVFTAQVDLPKTKKSHASEHHEEPVFSGYSEVGTKGQSWLYTSNRNDTVIIFFVKDDQIDINRFFFKSVSMSTHLLKILRSSTEIHHWMDKKWQMGVQWKWGIL